MAEVLFEAGLMLAVLALAGTVARRINQSVIPFYVLSGMIMSPFVLGRLGFDSVAGYAIELQTYITLLAELGIVFLLFFLGLEFSLDRLLGSSEKIGKAGTLDLLVNLPAGVIIGLLLGWSVLEAFVLGGIVYISSSAVITKSLIDLGWIANDESNPILGTLVYEDLFIAFYLAVLSAILLGGGALATIAVDVAVAMGFLLALVSAVYLGTDHFGRFLDVDSEEMFVLRAVAVTVFVAGFALAIGVSEAVAAFFIGMGFSGTDHLHDLERRLIPFRDVFAAVFFFWIGLRTDPAVFPAVAGVVALLVVVTAPTKLFTGFFGGRFYGLDDRRNVRVGLGMVTRGEFSLIIAAIAADSTIGGTVLTDTIPAVAVGYVLVMSILGTMLMQYSGRFERYVVDGRSAAPAE
ncbi:cation:proton antiporter [Natronomonas salsuginis]|jgi:CPA2 family monovalent cation:H+ antiporter-2|uniref:Cation:proton antiporter n=1 Tax=Natronomonas salsuginis TaxID=2217661 RepID=A0A4U5JC85_9EURY|nr:cation:proton antiporter [Natronomonas salsuginis]TKR25901.1 cation:proton antiporter [Natronomonas salsuginis]